MWKRQKREAGNTMSKTQLASAIDLALWTILDSTPEGRGTDWYPKLDYGNKK